MINILTLLILAATAWAGGSIFGTQPTGDPLPNGGVRSMGLSGAGLAATDSIGIHGENAAAMTQLTGSVLRAGLYGSIYGTSDQNKSDLDSEFGWQSFRLMLNIHPRYKMAFGLDPVSRTDLRTFANDSLTYESDTGAVVERFERRNVWLGSATDIRWDHAFGLSDKFSIGLTAAFTTTYLEVNSILDFPTSGNSGGARDVHYHDVQRFHGFWGGVSALAKLSPAWTLGGYWKSEADGTWEFEQRVNHGGEYRFSEENGSRPGEFGFGIGHKWRRDWSAYADLRSQSWKEKHYGPVFEEKGLEERSGFAVMFGVEKQGGTRITDEGFDRWDYRAGAAYRLQPWQVYSEGAVGDVIETALSLGVSVPLAQSTGKLHAALEFGVRTASDVDVDETFTRLYLQLDMHERWFHRERRKLRD
ncbi:hypothetical protein HUU59_02580 [bacterium]|nr:hypothetical protein [bacterium]